MEDEREEELSTLSSIYPELVRDASEPFRFSLVIPVSPETPVEIRFNHSDHALVEQDRGSKRTFRHLPPLNITGYLPIAYPAASPPAIKLSTSPDWITLDKLKELESEATKLWNEYGGCQVLFAYVDSLQQAADRAFDLADNHELPQILEGQLVEFDNIRQKDIFEAGTYDCGVCLDPKKGTFCHRMHSCGHVFCRSCLQDFYNSAISEGDIVNVACLEPSCGKTINGGRQRKKKSLHPRELLEIGILEPQARRFVEMKRKKILETDKSTVYCPRTWCQAPARDLKHPPIPANLLDYVESDDSCDEHPTLAPTYDKDTPEDKLPAAADRLTICGKCSFAFCRVCFGGWHGEFARCWPRNPGELSAEEKASYEYIMSNTSACPTCSSPTQKTKGCNHMLCFQCNSHFCYLCGAWLEPGDPYKHFNNKNNKCYMRLWENDGMDGDDVAIEHEAAAMAVAAAAADDQGRQPARAVEEPPVEVVEEPPVQMHRLDEMAAVRAQARARPRPHPGPIDPMHARALRREEMQAPGQMENVLAVQEVDAPVGGRRRDRGRGRTQARVNNDGRNGARRPPQVAPQDMDGRINGDVNGRRQVPPIPAADDDGGAQARQEAAIRRFIAMAIRDEEDEWDSDELDDDVDFEIR